MSRKTQRPGDGVSERSDPWLGLRDNYKRNLTVGGDVSAPPPRKGRRGTDGQFVSDPEIKSTSSHPQGRANFTIPVARAIRPAPFFEREQIRGMLTPGEVAMVDSFTKGSQRPAHPELLNTVRSLEECNAVLAHHRLFFTLPGLTTGVGTMRVRHDQMPHYVKEVYARDNDPRDDPADIVLRRLGNPALGGDGPYVTEGVDMLRCVHPIYPAWVPNPGGGAAVKKGVGPVGWLCGIDMDYEHQKWERKVPAQPPDPGDPYNAFYMFRDGAGSLHPEPQYASVPRLDGEMMAAVATVWALVRKATLMECKRRTGSMLDWQDIDWKDVEDDDRDIALYGLAKTPDLYAPSAFCDLAPGYRIYLPNNEEFPPKINLARYPNQNLDNKDSQFYDFVIQLDTQFKLGLRPGAAPDTLADFESSDVANLRLGFVHEGGPENPTLVFPGKVRRNYERLLADCGLDFKPDGVVINKEDSSFTADTTEFAYRPTELANVAVKGRATLVVLNGYDRLQPRHPLDASSAEVWTASHSAALAAVKGGNMAPALLGRLQSYLASVSVYANRFQYGQPPYDHRGDPMVEDARDSIRGVLADPSADPAVDFAQREASREGFVGAGHSDEILVCLDLVYDSPHEVALSSAKQPVYGGTKPYPVSLYSMGARFEFRRERLSNLRKFWQQLLPNRTLLHVWRVARVTDRNKFTPIPPHPNGVAGALPLMEVNVNIEEVPSWAVWPMLIGQSPPVDVQTESRDFRELVMRGSRYMTYKEAREAFEELGHILESMLDPTDPFSDPIDKGDVFEFLRDVYEALLNKSTTAPTALTPVLAVKRLQRLAKKRQADAAAKAAADAEAKAEALKNKLKAAEKASVLVTTAQRRFRERRAEELRLEVEKQKKAAGSSSVSATMRAIVVDLAQKQLEEGNKVNEAPTAGVLMPVSPELATRLEEIKQKVRTFEGEYQTRSKLVRQQIKGITDTIAADLNNTSIDGTQLKAKFNDRVQEIIAAVDDTSDLHKLSEDALQNIFDAQAYIVHYAGLESIVIDEAARSSYSSENMVKLIFAKSAKRKDDASGQIESETFDAVKIAKDMQVPVLSSAVLAYVESRKVVVDVLDSMQKLLAGPKREAQPREAYGELLESSETLTTRNDGEYSPALVSLDSALAMALIPMNDGYVQVFNKGLRSLIKQAEVLLAASGSELLYDRLLVPMVKQLKEADRLKLGLEAAKGGDVALGAVATDERLVHLLRKMIAPDALLYLSGEFGRKENANEGGQIPQSAALFAPVVREGKAEAASGEKGVVTEENVLQKLNSNARRFMKVLRKAQAQKNDKNVTSSDGPLAQADLYQESNKLLAEMQEEGGGGADDEAPDDGAPDLYNALMETKLTDRGLTSAVRELLVRFVGSNLQLPDSAMRFGLADANLMLGSVQSDDDVKRLEKTSEDLMTDLKTWIETDGNSAKSRMLSIAGWVFRGLAAFMPTGDREGDEGSDSAAMRLRAIKVRLCESGFLNNEKDIAASLTNKIKKLAPGDSADATWLTKIVNEQMVESVLLSEDAESLQDAFEEVASTLNDATATLKERLRETELASEFEKATLDLKKAMNELKPLSSAPVSKAIVDSVASEAFNDSGRTVETLERAFDSSDTAGLQVAQSLVESFADPVALHRYRLSVLLRHPPTSRFLSSEFLEWAKLWAVKARDRKLPRETWFAQAKTEGATALAYTGETQDSQLKRLYELAVREPRQEITYELVQRRFSRYSPYSANGHYTDTRAATYASAGDVQHLVRMSHGARITRSFCTAVVAIVTHALEIAKKRLNADSADGAAQLPLAVALAKIAYEFFGEKPGAVDASSVNAKPTAMITLLDDSVSVGVPAVRFDDDKWHQSHYGEGAEKSSEWNKFQKERASAAEAYAESVGAKAGEYTRETRDLTAGVAVATLPRTDIESFTPDWKYTVMDEMAWSVLLKAIADLKLTGVDNERRVEAFLSFRKLDNLASRLEAEYEDVKESVPRPAAPPDPGNYLERARRYVTELEGEAKESSATHRLEVDRSTFTDLELQTIQNLVDVYERAVKGYDALVKAERERVKQEELARVAAEAAAELERQRRQQEQEEQQRLERLERERKQRLADATNKLGEIMKTLQGAEALWRRPVGLKEQIAKHVEDNQVNKKFGDLVANITGSLVGRNSDVLNSLALSANGDDVADPDTTFATLDKYASQALLVLTSRKDDVGLLRIQLTARLDAFSKEYVREAAEMNSVTEGVDGVFPEEVIKTTVLPKLNNSTSEHWQYARSDLHDVSKTKLSIAKSAVLEALGDNETVASRDDVLKALAAMLGLFDVDKFVPTVPSSSVLTNVNKLAEELFNDVNEAKESLVARVKAVKDELQRVEDENRIQQALAERLEAVTGTNVKNNSILTEVAAMLAESERNKYATHARKRELLALAHHGPSYDLNDVRSSTGINTDAVQKILGVEPVRIPSGGNFTEDVVEKLEQAVKANSLALKDVVPNFDSALAKEAESVEEAVVDAGLFALLYARMLQEAEKAGVAMDDNVPENAMRESNVPRTDVAEKASEKLDVSGDDVSGDDANNSEKLAAEMTGYLFGSDEQYPPWTGDMAAPMRAALDRMKDALTDLDARIQKKTEKEQNDKKQGLLDELPGLSEQVADLYRALQKSVFQSEKSEYRVTEEQFIQQLKALKVATGATMALVKVQSVKRDHPDGNAMVDESDPNYKDRWANTPIEPQHLVYSAFSPIDAEAAFKTIEERVDLLKELVELLTENQSRVDRATYLAAAYARADEAANAYSKEVDQVVVIAATILGEIRKDQNKVKKFGIWIENGAPIEDGETTNKSLRHRLIHFTDENNNERKEIKQLRKKEAAIRDNFGLGLDVEMIAKALLREIGRSVGDKNFTLEEYPLGLPPEPLSDFDPKSVAKTIHFSTTKMYEKLLASDTDKTKELTQDELQRWFQNYVSGTSGSTQNNWKGFGLNFVLRVLHAYTGRPIDLNVFKKKDELYDAFDDLATTDAAKKAQAAALAMVSNGTFTPLVSVNGTSNADKVAQELSDALKAIPGKKRQDVAEIMWARAKLAALLMRGMKNSTQGGTDPKPLRRMPSLYGEVPPEGGNIAAAADDDDDSWGEWAEAPAPGAPADSATSNSMWNDLTSVFGFNR